MSDSIGGGGPPEGPGPAALPGGGAPPAGIPQPGGPGGAPNPILAAVQRMRGTPPVSAPGPGDQAGGLLKVRQATELLQTALPSLGVGSEAHHAVVKAIEALSKHIPQGAPVEGAMQTNLGDMMRNAQRQAMMQRVAAMQSGAPGGGAAPTPTSPIPGA